MKYYSELTKKVYDTEELLVTAENELKDKQALEEKKNAQRAVRAKEVEQAYKHCVEARKTYEKLLSDFCKDYKYFHTTINYNDALDLIDRFHCFTWPW